MEKLKCGMCMSFLTLILVVSILIVATRKSRNTAQGIYMLDKSWSPQFPNGTNSFNAVDAVGDRVYIGQRAVSYPDPVLIMDWKGAFLSSFAGKDVALGTHHGTTERGLHGLTVERTLPGIVPENPVYVMDFFNHTVLTYDSGGRLLNMVGHGASSHPDKFDSPADVAFAESLNMAFFVDGDGGSNMRVSAWTLQAPGRLGRPIWTNPNTPPQNRTQETFDHPHSVCWHESSGKVIVADRDYWRIVIMSPDKGEVEGELVCPGLNLGPSSKQGRPFGVRTLTTPSADLLFVAVSGNAGIETDFQFLHVLDISTLKAGRLACASILQTIEIDPSHCPIPHLIGVDDSRGYVYVACNKAPNSNVIRFAPTLSVNM